MISTYIKYIHIDTIILIYKLSKKSCIYIIDVLHSNNDLLHFFKKCFQQTFLCWQHQQYNYATTHHTKLLFQGSNHLTFKGGALCFFSFFFFISLTKFYSKIYFALKYAHTKNNNLTLHILTRKSDNVWRKKYRFFMSKKKKANNLIFVSCETIFLAQGKKYKPPPP
jgi:hypothetical protein